jgi:hypothetical protein
LGLNEEFEKIYEIPAIIDRHNYLKKYKDFSNARLEEKFLRSIILFSLFIVICISNLCYLDAAVTMKDTGLCT